jgi:hypothetical protein
MPGAPRLRFPCRSIIASGAPNPGAAVLFGIFKGTMPCADCSGLDTVLRLYAKDKKDKYDTPSAFYVRTQTYQLGRDQNQST